LQKPRNSGWWERELPSQSGKERGLARHRKGIPNYVLLIYIDIWTAQVTQ
jgi:hypothetical protein